MACCSHKLDRAHRKSPSRIEVVRFSWSNKVRFTCFPFCESFCFHFNAIFASQLHYDGRVSKLMRQSQRGRDRRHEICKTLMKSCSTNRNFRTLHCNHVIIHFINYDPLSSIINFHQCLSRIIQTYPSRFHILGPWALGPLGHCHHLSGSDCT